MKKALITGITGQDGSYLAEFLLEKGYEVHGITRRASISNTARIDHLIRKNANVGVEIDYRHELVEGDTACQYSYYYASIIGKGTASIIDNPREKLKALNVIMKHQTGRTFDEFQKNPNLEKAVAIIRIDLNEYSCKKHI